MAAPKALARSAPPRWAGKVAIALVDPALPQGVVEAHRGGGLGTVGRGDREVRAGCAEGLRGRRRSRRQKVGRDHQADHHQSSPGRDPAEHRVEQEHDREIEGQPGQVDDRDWTRSRQELPHLVEVADRLRPRAFRHVQRDRHRAIKSARRQHRDEMLADPGQHPGAGRVEHREERVEDSDERDERDEGRDAAARQDPIVDLQHEQGAGER
jgi:hypothetical protein